MGQRLHLVDADIGDKAHIVRTARSQIVLIADRAACPHRHGRMQGRGPQRQTVDQIRQPEDADTRHTKRQAQVQWAGVVRHEQRGARQQAAQPAQAQPACECGGRRMHARHDLVHEIHFVRRTVDGDTGPVLREPVAQRRERWRRPAAPRIGRPRLQHDEPFTGQPGHDRRGLVPVGFREREFRLRVKR
jgi:hypothetical protein